MLILSCSVLVDIVTQWSVNEQKKTVPKILRDLQKINNKRNVKVRYYTRDGYYTLFLDITVKGYKRRKENLDLKVYGTSTKLQEDRSTLEIARSIRDKREQEIIENKYDLDLNLLIDDMDFIAYFEEIVRQHPDDHRCWQNTLNHLRKFSKDELKLASVNDSFCQGFYDYLLKNIAINTAGMYLSKIKTALNRLVKEKRIPRNPAQFVSIKSEDTHREFLTDEELNTLVACQTPYIEMRSAFLFSCMTGLRLSDIKKVRHSNLEGRYLKVHITKTKENVRIPLSQSALTILEKVRDQRPKDDLAFRLTTDQNVNRQLRLWVTAAGIDKHISFHCARHTFATRCLPHGLDVNEVRKLLAHKDIRATMVYAKSVDKNWNRRSISCRYWRKYEQ